MLTVGGLYCQTVKKTPSSSWGFGNRSSSNGLFLNLPSQTITIIARLLHTSYIIQENYSVKWSDLLYLSHQTQHNSFLHHLFWKKINNIARSTLENCTYKVKVPILNCSYCSAVYYPIETYLQLLNFGLEWITATG